MAFGLLRKVGVNPLGGNRYVYYERLRTDAFGESDGTSSGNFANYTIPYDNIALYENAVSLLQARVNSGANVNNIAEYFRRLRDAEFRKESMILQQYFGKEILGSYQHPNKDSAIGQQLVHAFNAIFSIKKAFNYHLNLLQKTRQRGAAAYVTYYFDKEWQKYITDPTNAQKLKDELGNALLTNNPQANAIAVFKSHVEKVIYATLESMYGSKGQSGSDYREETPYQFLLNTIKKQKEMNPSIYQMLVLKMMNGLGITKIINEYVSKIVDGKVNEIDISNINMRTMKKLKTKSKKEIDDESRKIMKDGKTTYTTDLTKGGVMAEIQGWFIALMRSAQGGFTVAHTGKTKQKADYRMAINFKGQKLSELKGLTPETVGKAREDYVREAKIIKDYLDKINGILVYVNAKDYTIGGHYWNEKAGFTAEEDIKLGQWDQMLKTMHLASHDIVFMMLQLMDGAIGNVSGSNYIDDVSRLMARAIAGALFDDFDVDGVVSDSGGKTIHLLYLNGIYIPLSFFYDKLYQAFISGGSDAGELVQVDITTAPIQFPTMESQRAWERDHPDESAWAFQREIALQQIKISYHFFKGFKEAMQEIGMMM